MATILIVDDIASNRDYLVTVLRHYGHQLFEAADGREGLDAVHTHHPDLVITDVLMPVMDGFELVRQLRLDPATSKVPVVFYTAHYSGEEARALAWSSGVSDVLMKPVQSAEVLKVVGRVLAGEWKTPLPPDAAPLTSELQHEHVRLLTDKLSEKVGDLETANARLRALIDIGVELASEGDVERRLHNLCGSARELFGATYVTLGILDPDEGKLQRVVTCGAYSGNWIAPGERVPGILGKVVAERRTFRGNNPPGDPAALDLPLLHPQIRAFLAAPIASPARVYGWICLVGNAGGTFTDEDEQLVIALAGQVGRIDELEHQVVERKSSEDEIRHQAEALRTAEERMRFALEAAGVGIWDQDFSTGALEWSDNVYAHYGVQPGTFGGTFEAFIERVHPADRDSVLEIVGRAMKSGEDFSVLHRTVWPDGTVHWLNNLGRIRLGEHGEPLRAVGISLDVTERHKLEEQYQQAQKMEAVGRLAGGVAHDFNNLLTVILGSCDLLLGDIAPDDPHQADIEEIQRAGTSASLLTRQLLAFSRKQIIEPTLLDLNAVVSDMRGMLARLIREDVKVVLALSTEPAPVIADRGQIEQIVMNLAVNAQDAMLKGGTLTIETATTELDEHYAKMHQSAKPGTYIVLTVSDTGTGMTPEVQAHLFEPFFTTKEVGKGTGLGLATVHGIVTLSGGTVNVYSEVGRGTSLKVYLPMADASERIVEAAPPPLRPRAGGETVLVVEDADGLRALARKLLERLGYNVLVAANAQEAIQLFEGAIVIDVLLTDVVMPGASGPELTRQLIDLQPSLRVVYMSGYTEDAITQHGVLSPGIAFLHKPFTSDALGRKIREVLDR